MTDLAFEAHAELTEATDGLTPSEVRDVAAYARTVKPRRSSTGSVTSVVLEASDWRGEVLPLLHLLHVLIPGSDTLAEVAALVEQEAREQEKDEETAHLGGGYLRDLAERVFAIANTLALVDPDDLGRMISAIASTCPELPATSPDAPT